MPWRAAELAAAALTSEVSMRAALAWPEFIVVCALA